MDALYGGKQLVHVEAQVQYEDGRTGIDFRGPEDPRREDLRRRRGEEGGLMAQQAAPREIGEVILAVEDVSLAFGGVKALSDVSFDVREHEVRAIIGPNGAGKSSMLNVINGVYHPQQGTIRLPAARASSTTWTRTRSRRAASRAPSRTSRCSRACRCWTTS